MQLNLNNIEFNVRILLDGNPNNLSTYDAETQMNIINSIGRDYFTPMESLEEAFDYFRTIITQKDCHANGAFKMLIKAHFFFAKAIYQSQFNKGVYDRNKMVYWYNKFFDEKTIAANLSDYSKDGDLFWHWALELLKKMGYEE